MLSSLMLVDNFLLNLCFRLICCTCEWVDGWKIARNSGARIFMEEEVAICIRLFNKIKR